MDDHYYYGLNPEKLAHNDYWLIVIIEAASYCESRHEEYIRYSRLKANSDEALNRITKGERSNLGGGSFASIINSCCRKGFFRVEKVNRKETRIYPNISAIKKEVEAKKIENLEYGNKRMIRIIGNDATVHYRKTLSDSVSVSERLDAIVTRANPKEVPK